MLDIIAYLCKRGEIHVCLVVLGDQNDYSEQTEDLSITWMQEYVRPSFWKKHQVRVDTFQEFLDEWEPDIIHTHLFQADFLVRYVTKGRIPVVTHFHDNIPQYKAFSMAMLLSKKSITNFYEKRLIIQSLRNGVNRFIAISRHTHDYVHRTLHPSPSQLVLLPNAIDLDRFSISESQVFANSGDITLVNVGSLVNKKNQQFLLRVMNLLPEKYQLDLLGDGPNMGKLTRQVEENDLQNRVRLIGTVNEPEAYYQSSNLYVHAATYEPFGLVLLEAMACGLPVVTLDGGGNRDIVQNGYNGFLLKEADEKKFAQKIQEIIDNPDLYQKLREGALLTAQNFGMDAYAERLIELYRGVLDEATHRQTHGNSALH